MGPRPHAALYGLPVLLFFLTVVGCPERKEAPGVAYGPDGTFSGKIAAPTKNVILIVIDTLRADRLHVHHGSERKIMPALDALEPRCLSFLNAAGPIPLTTPAHATLFTGKYPCNNGVRDNNYVLGAEHATLAEILRQQGYRTAAFVSAYTVNSDFGLAQGFEVYDDACDEAMFRPMENPDKDNVRENARRNGRKSTDLALKWLDAHKDERFFLWLHLFDAHSPYESEYAAFFGKPRWSYYEDIAFFRRNPVHSEEGRAHLENIINLYDGGVRFCDDQVKRLLDRLEALGLLGDALIVVVSDHGESIGEHRYFDHALNLYEPDIRIPLMIHDKTLEPRRISEQVGLADVMPTMLGLLGLPVPPGIDGAPLVPDKEGRVRERPLFLEAAACRHDPPANPCYPDGIEGKRTAIRFDGKKAIMSPGSNQLEYYDLRKDPRELENLYSRSDAGYGDLQQVLMRWRSGWNEGGEGEKRVDEETLEKLRSLGYLQ